MLLDLPVYESSVTADLHLRQKEAERRREDALKREREAQKRIQRKQAYQQVTHHNLLQKRNKTQDVVHFECDIMEKQLLLLVSNMLTHNGLCNNKSSCACFQMLCCLSCLPGCCCLIA